MEEHDYSRFSDGPRRVPTPRGPSLERAQRLGLGTRETARTLLRHGATEDWTRAANWRGRAVDRLLWPIDDGRYVRGFGYVRTTRPDLLHRGIDIAADEGAPVRAAADGIVAYSDNQIRGYGNCVLIVHPNGWISLYAHNSRVTVQPGWRVRRGERIALVGSTGIAHGPHVHFELHRAGDAIDPLRLFDGGPAFVRRVANGRALDADDRTEHAPLADERRPIEQTDLGSDRLARRLLRFRPTEALCSAAAGRVFRDVLFPARGGTLRSSSVDGARIDTPTAVRAAADGLVVYAGPLGPRGDAIVLVHPNGWVTIYGGLATMSVAAGDRVERGVWIARASRLRFEVRVEGRAVDPASVWTQAPR